MLHPMMAAPPLAPQWGNGWQQGGRTVAVVTCKLTEDNRSYVSPCLPSCHRSLCQPELKGPRFCGSPLLQSHLLTSIGSPGQVIGWIHPGPIQHTTNPVLHHFLLLISSSVLHLYKECRKQAGRKGYVWRTVCFRDLQPG